jgi:cob(I)alamin adenosyltransferase
LGFFIVIPVKAGRVSGMLKGLVHIYTGNGKGKTTAAVGLGVRAFGSGCKVLMAQFLKARESGEIEFLKGLGRGFKVMRSAYSGKFTWQMNETELTEAREKQNRFFDEVEAEGCNGQWDMLILDEILEAVRVGMIDAARIEKLIREKPEGLELVLTGRDAPELLVEASDYVSEIREIKHPFRRGISARKGIEE